MLSGGGAGLGDRLVDVEQESSSVRVASSARELDLGVAAQRLAGPRHPADGLGRASSREMRSLCLRWMSLVAMNRWRCGRSATPMASTARCGSPSLQRASAATAIPPFVSLAMRRTASKSPGRRGREAGLDDVHLEARELARDLQLLRGGQAGAGRLLAVTQGGVEDPDRARPRRPRRSGG